MLLTVKLSFQLCCSLLAHEVEPKSTLSTKRMEHITCGYLEALYGTGHIVLLCPQAEVAQSVRSESLDLIQRLLGIIFGFGFMSCKILLSLSLFFTWPLHPGGVEVRTGVLRKTPYQGH